MYSRLSSLKSGLIETTYYQVMIKIELCYKMIKKHFAPII